MEDSSRTETIPDSVKRLKDHEKANEQLATQLADIANIQLRCKQTYPLLNND